ncbi:MAG: hypothetical protein ACREBN_00195, partial [Burkholderiaceae bacterium]
MPTPPLQNSHTSAAATSLLRKSWAIWWSAWSTYPANWPSDGMGWMQYGWTFLFNTAIALALTVVGLLFTRTSAEFGQHFLGNLLFAQCIGFTIHLMFQVGASVIGRKRLATMTWSWRVIFYGGVPIAGMFIGYSIAFALMGCSIIDVAQRAPNFIIGTAALSLIFSAVLYQFFKQKALVA